MQLIRNSGLIKTVLCFLIGVLSVSGADAKADYAQLAKAIEVKELNTLMFAKSSDANLAMVGRFSRRTRRRRNANRPCTCWPT